MHRQTLLSGMRVLDLSRYLPGPYATLRLADMGADVVKVEEPKAGDPLRHLPPTGEKNGFLFQMINRNKRSLALDYRRPEGQELLRRLVVEADVVVESFRPGVMASWGLDAATLTQINPSLIYCSVTGYGQEGKMAQMAGHDLNYNALTGVLDGVGRLGEPPGIPSVQIADLAGGLAGSEQILAAWVHRLQTGEGTVLDISMVDVLYGWQAYALSLQQSGHPVSRGNHVLGGGVVGYNLYETADNQYMALGALEPKFWNRFADAVNRPEWKERGLTPIVADPDLYREVQALFRSRTREEWTRIGREADCCLTPVFSLSEAVDSRLAKDRRAVFSERKMPSTLLPNGGTLREEGPGPQVASAPRLGEHTEERLAEAGCSQEEIARLVREKVISGGVNPG